MKEYTLKYLVDVLDNIDNTKEAQGVETYLFSYSKIINDKRYYDTFKFLKNETIANRVHKIKTDIINFSLTNEIEFETETDVDEDGEMRIIIDGKIITLPIESGEVKHSWFVDDIKELTAYKNNEFFCTSLEQKVEHIMYNFHRYQDTEEIKGFLESELYKFILSNNESKKLDFKLDDKKSFIQKIINKI